MPITISSIHFSRAEVVSPFAPNPTYIYLVVHWWPLLLSKSPWRLLALLVTYIKNDLRPPPVKYLEDFSQFLMMMMAAGNGTKLLAPLPTSSSPPRHLGCRLGGLISADVPDKRVSKNIVIKNNHTNIINKLKFLYLNMLTMTLQLVEFTHLIAIQLRDTNRWYD